MNQIDLIEPAPADPPAEPLEHGGYLPEDLGSEKRKHQAEVFNKPLAQDVFTLLQLFENERGIDVGQSWLDLLQRYHSVYDEPDKKPRTSWRPDRLRKALDQAEALGLVCDGIAEWGKDWMLTAKGAQARKAETVRRMRDGHEQ